MIKKAKKGWIGFDLDNTLATDTPFRRDDSLIGYPKDGMVKVARELIENGEDVRIFTARAYKMDTLTKIAIENWCLIHLGKILPIQAHKDHDLLYFFDDKAQPLGPHFD